MNLLVVGIGIIVGASIAVFLLVTLSLVGLLLFARKKLMPQGKELIVLKRIAIIKIKVVFIIKGFYKKRICYNNKRQ